MAPSTARTWHDRTAAGERLFQGRATSTVRSTVQPPLPGDGQGIGAPAPFEPHRHVKDVALEVRRCH
eukprot:4021509-Alexandrium_andersonii.AAC.1